jgi:hypothetical protein
MNRILNFYIDKVYTYLQNELKKCNKECVFDEVLNIYNG